MTDTQKLSPADAAKELWKHLDGKNVTVMLGINNPESHSQPMTAYAERENNQVWFFTRDDVDLAVEAQNSPEARLIFASKDQEVFADIRGQLAVRVDKARIDKYWNPVTAAWYPEGKNDPHLVLLRFTPVEGQVWVSDKGIVRFAFEIAKANVTKSQPDAGGVTDVQFDR